MRDPAAPSPEAPPPEPRRLLHPPRGRVLVFAPHPDDEVAGPGGALARHRAQGDIVRVIVATDGRNGDPERRFDPASYAARRRDESRAGLAEVGVDDVVFWGFPDGHVPSPSDLARGAQMAADALRSFAPDVVYLPWAREGHPDHHAVHVAVVMALDAVAFRGLALGYEVWNALVPDVVLDVTAVIEQKLAAMRAHRSQIDYVTYDHAILGLAAYRSLVHQRGRGYAEGFVVVRGSLPPDAVAGPGR
jgi:LmbE family N-acetylglucosaminyl deacetylase